VTSVNDALCRARSLGLDRLDAQLLIAHATGRERSWVIAHGEAPIDAVRIESLLARRAAGEPLAYLTGWRAFHGIELQVTPDVLVPRPDTETLVDWALALLEGQPAAPRVIDLGTGSGAIALALKLEMPHARVSALDVSREALAVARANAARLALDVACHEGSWWDAVPGQTFNLALANPPYVAVGDLHLAALSHEPAQALVPAGDRGDGLADIERIVAGAPAHLASGAWLLIEHGVEQAAAVGALLEAQGFEGARTRLDLAGRPRVTGARWPG
jgi:release factor glutamine methyltransferase